MSRWRRRLAIEIAYECKCGWDEVCIVQLTCAFAREYVENDDGGNDLLTYASAFCTVTFFGLNYSESIIKLFSIDLKCEI